jgi:hypothetical protein
MNKLILGCLGLAVLTSPVFAQLSYSVEADIPFGFQVGPAHFAAGKYHIGAALGWNQES